MGTVDELADLAKRHRRAGGKEGDSGDDGDGDESDDNQTSDLFDEHEMTALTNFVAEYRREQQEALGLTVGVCIRILL